MLITCEWLVTTTIAFWNIEIKRFINVDFDIEFERLSFFVMWIRFEKLTTSRLFFATRLREQIFCMKCWKSTRIKMTSLNVCRQQRKFSLFEFSFVRFEFVKSWCEFDSTWNNCVFWWFSWFMKTTWKLFTFLQRTK